MKKHYLLLSSAFVLSMLSFVSCTKEDIVAATDNSPVVAAASIDLVNELDIKTGQEISFNKLTAKQSGKSAAVCYTTTDVSTANFPKTYTIDFGTGCTLNGITRKGVLKITFTDVVTAAGSTMKIERKDYYVNGNKVEGTITYENKTVSSDAPQWTRTVADGKYTDLKGDVYSNSGTFTVKQTAGASTTIITDDTYEMISGNHTVSKQNGAKITLTVAESLVKKFDCDYISKGKLNVESTLLKGQIDFGNVNDCDTKATFTSNGIAFPIEMK